MASDWSVNQFPIQIMLRDLWLYLILVSQFISDIWDSEWPEKGKLSSSSGSKSGSRRGQVRLTADSGQGQTGEPDQRLCSLSLACDRVFYLHRSVLCIRLLLLCWVFSFNWILKLELFSVSMTFPILRTVLCRSTRSRFRITSVPFAKCILLLGSLSQRWSSRCSLQVLSMQTTKRFSSRSEEKLPILILYENLLGVGLDRCISVGSRVESVLKQFETA